MIRLPERWSEWFFGDDDDFNLHDFIKVTAAHHGIATQVIGDNPLTYRDRCSVAWRLLIAAYTKAGGVSWKLADTTPNTMFVGIGYALRSIGANGSRSITGTGLCVLTRDLLPAPR